MSRSEFWKDRQAEFEKYARQYSDLEAHWKVAFRTWFFWWGKTAAGIDVPQECLDVFNAIARKAVTELPRLAGVGSSEPWSDWLDYMMVRRWEFRVTGLNPCTEREWDAGVKDGKPLLAVRREQNYRMGDEWKKVYRRTRSGNLRRLSARELRGKTSNDLQRYYHWLEDGIIEHVFESSARLSEDLAARTFEWEKIRREFESLPPGEYSLIWSSHPPTSLSGEQVSSLWTWFRPTDPNLREQATGAMAKAAKARGYDSEDGWLSELRDSKFVGFKLSGKSRDPGPDGAYMDTVSGMLRDAVKHSITLCRIAEAESPDAPLKERISHEDLQRAGQTDSKLAVELSSGEGSEGPALNNTPSNGKQSAGAEKPTSLASGNDSRTDLEAQRGSVPPPSGLQSDPTGWMNRALETISHAENSHTELRRKHQKTAEDLQAWYDRQGVNPQGAKDEEELIRDARKYAESYLSEARSPEARLVVTRRIWNDFIPRHRSRQAFRLTFEALHSAVWTGGSPSLEERASTTIQEQSRSATERKDNAVLSAKPGAVSKVPTTTVPELADSGTQPGRATGVSHQAELARIRQEVIMPILSRKRWKRGKWATAAGVGKNSIYEYLGGKRDLSPENRKAMAEAIGLRPEQLPD